MTTENVFNAGLLTGILTGSLFMFIMTDQKKVYESEIKPFKCVSVQELRYYITMYDIYIDSLNYGSKKNRPRYADSTRKFGKILRQND